MRISGFSMGHTRNLAKVKRASLSKERYESKEDQIEKNRCLIKIINQEYKIEKLSRLK